MKIGAEMQTLEELTAEVLKLLWYTPGLIGPEFTVTEITPDSQSTYKQDKGAGNMGTMCWESDSVNRLRRLYDFG